MIDIVENVLQIVILAICVIITITKAVRFGSRSWTILSFFYGSWLLGDLYWLVCLIIYGATPEISVVSDLSWYAAHIFLYLLLRHLLPPENAEGIHPLSWLGPVFALGMAIFFMFWGEIISNLIYGALMSLILFSAIRRLVDKSTPRHKLFLPLCALVYALLLYALWVSSCFWDETVPLHPYYVFDFLITLSFPFFLFTTRKAVAE